MITCDSRWTCETKSGIAMPKVAFKKKKIIFTGKLELNLKKKLEKCCIWSIKLCGVLKIGYLGSRLKKYLGSFEMLCWRRMEKIILTDCVRNE
jgi:hypothetical protein